jgi:hypothetical protein
VLSIRGRMELHLYPDGAEGWCLTWKEPLIDTAGVIRGLAGISRDAPALSGSAPVSAALSATLAYIDDHLDEPLRVPELAARAFPHSSSIKESGLCSASPPVNICRERASTGLAIA